MKKYLVLYMAPLATIDKMVSAPPEEQKKGMDKWMKWMNSHQADFVAQGSPIGKNMRVTATGVMPQRNEVTGYSIVQADSPEQASLIFKDSPHLAMDGAWIDILEMPQMSV